MSRAWARPVVFWLLWLLAVLPVVWRKVATSDAWWHVALGQWIWRHHGAPDYAEWYFTPVLKSVPDLRWTWLGDLAMAGAFFLAGPAGLQAFSLVWVIVGALILWKLHSRDENHSTFWSWAVLVALGLGTYQLQLPRNAVLSLPLLASVLWICIAGARRWWLIPVAGLWSVLHGSYPLAVILPTAWLAGEILDRWRDGARGQLRWIGQMGLIIAGCVAVVSIANPPALAMLAQPFRQALRQAPPVLIAAGDDGEKPAAGENASQPAPPPPTVKRWLNGLLWSAGPGGVRSGDFVSPFDRMGYLAVPVAFGLALLAWGRLILAQRWRWSWCFTLAVLSVMGCAYFRMTGYLALGAAACLLAGPPLRPVPGQWLPRIAPVIGGAVALLSVAAWWLALTDRLGAVLGKVSHEFACGASPTFDDRAAAWALENRPAQRTFTTIVTGSHALLTWAGQKPVFMDGFFAPHPHAVLEDYRKANEENSPLRLRERYAIELALIEHGRSDWNNTFLNSPEWRPLAIGSGAAVYGLRRDAKKEIAPVLLTNAVEVRELPPYFQQVLATNYHGAIAALVLAKEVEAARGLRAADTALYDLLRTRLTSRQQSVCEIITRSLDGSMQIRERPRVAP